MEITWKFPKGVLINVGRNKSGAQVTKVKVDVDVDGVVHISCPSASCEENSTIFHRFLGSQSRHSLVDVMVTD